LWQLWAPDPALAGIPDMGTRCECIGVLPMMPPGMAAPDPRARDPVSDRAVDLIAELSRDHRILAIVIPRGIPAERVVELWRTVNVRLEQLARRYPPPGS
jgi:hypothetical protein